MIKSVSSEKYRLLLKWLRESREAKGITMRELGNRINETHSLIHKIENADRRLDVAEYFIYCKALGIDPYEGLKYLE